MYKCKYYTEKETYPYCNKMDNYCNCAEGKIEYCDLNAKTIEEKIEDAINLLKENGYVIFKKNNEL